MALTYMGLTNRVLRRLNETQLTSVTFASASGFHGQAKEAVNDAVNDILTAEKQWPFLRAAGTFDTVAGTDSYALPADMASVDWGSFWLEADVANDISAIKLRPVDVEYWEQRLLEQAKNATATSGRNKPEIVFQTKVPSIGLWKVPDDVYTINYTYWTINDELSAYTDETAIPDRYVKVIIDGAMWYAYMFRDNIESATKMEKKFKDGIERMRIELINRSQVMRSGQLPYRGSMVTPFD